MKYVFLCIVCCFLIPWTAADNNFTFTYSMAMRCSEHICTHGYSYDTFYRVDNSQKPKTSEIVFEMHFAILASSNGHILLSTILEPNVHDPVYEIGEITFFKPWRDSRVVGGGSNKFTELRRNLRRNSKTSAKTNNILSAIEFRAFYIRISEDGVIEFGREGEPLPILSYTDDSPITVRYFSFAAWNGIEAKYLYDCPAPGANDTESTPDSKEIERKLTPEEQIKQTLLRGKNPSLPPGPNVDVKVGVKITGIKYEVNEGKLEANLAMLVVWTDDGMAWNPAKFNDTTSITLRQGQIWRPTFFLFNSHDIGALDTKDPDLIKVVNSGEASFRFHTTAKTWFFNDTENRWPNDNYVCSLIFGAWEAHEQISLELISPDDALMKAFAGINEVIENVWDVTTLFNIIVKTKEWNMQFDISDTDPNQSDRLIVGLKLKRKNNAYNIAVYTSILVLISFVLSSFWNQPLQISRVWFYTGTVVLTSSVICYLSYLTPTNVVPSIMKFYVTILISVLVALIVQVMLMTTLMEKICKRIWVQGVLTSKWFRTLFCLPAMKTCKNYDVINEGYDIQEDDDSGVIIQPRNSNVEEMHTEKSNYGEKVELAEAIDKLFFVVYSIVFAVMLALHY